MRKAFLAGDLVHEQRARGNPGEPLDHDGTAPPEALVHVRKEYDASISQSFVNVDIVPADISKMTLTKRKRGRDSPSAPQAQNPALSLSLSHSRPSSSLVGGTNY